MAEAIDHDRHRFLGTAAMTIAATQLGGIGSAGAQTANTLPANTSLWHDQAFADAVVEVGSYARHSS